MELIGYANPPTIPNEYPRFAALVTDLAKIQLMKILLVNRHILLFYYKKNWSVTDLLVRKKIKKMLVEKTKKITKIRILIS